MPRTKGSKNRTKIDFEAQIASKRSIITHQGQKKKHLGQEVQKIR